jgi:hypothetical protein
VGKGAGRIVVHLEPSRALTTIACAIMVVLFTAAAVALLVHPLDEWKGAKFLPDVDLETATVIAVSAAGFIAWLCLVGAIVNGRRWRISRWAIRMSNDPTLGFLPDPEWSVSSIRATTIPPLEVNIVKARKLPRPHERRRRVTMDSNIVGRRPLKIAYLRLFENQPRIRTFVEGAWREFGYAHLLRSAAAVTPAEYRWARRSGNPLALFIRSPEQLDAELARQRVEPYGKGRYRFKSIGPKTIRVRDRYGSYPMRPLLCHGSFWKAAVDTLVDTVDLVVLDLSGLNRDNAGVLYELQRVVDRVPIEHVVFLIDQRSKKRFIAEQIQATWQQMADGSPNAVSTPKIALVVITDYIARSQSPQGQGQVNSVHVKLVARRRQTRRVVDRAQDRVEGLVR